MLKKVFSFWCLVFFLSCAQKTTAVYETAPVLDPVVIVDQPSENIQPQAISGKIEEMASSAAEPMKIPLDERVITGQLSNGMKYYIQKNQRPENRAELRLAINAGSILEDEDQKGLAHFVEHMAFNGTKNFEKSELVDYLESVGSRFGPDLNAYTSFDETVYMLQVRTDSMELFDKGMQIIRDWAADITFEDEEIDKERGVVVSEWRTRLSPDQRMQQKYFPVMYHNSHYAERLPIGDPEIVENASYETIKRFYKDWYRPDLMAVVVVGDIDEATAEAKIKDLFTDIEAHPAPRSREEYTVPKHEETLVSIASDEEASFTTVQMMYKHPKVKTKTVLDYRSGLVRSLYNGMLGSRLQEISREPDPPFMFAFSGYGGNVGDIDTYSAFAFAPEGKAPAALETLVTENNRVLRHGFNESEKDRQIKKMMERAEKALKERDKSESGNIAMGYVYNYLSESPVPGPKNTLELYEKYLPTIHLDEVNALAEKWIVDESRVIVVTGPEKEEVPLPSEAEVLNILNESDAKEVEPYEDEVIDVPFFPFELMDTEISKSEIIEEVGLEYIEMANGVEVYLKKTDFKNDEILMRATSPGGSSIYNDADYVDVNNAARIVSEAGLGEFSPVQINKLMAGKSVRVSPYIGNLSEGLNGASSPDDLETMMQMIYLYFTLPREDDKAYQSYITKQKGIYKNLMSNPDYYFSDYKSKVKFDNHPRVGWPKESDWESLEYERAMEIYRERFGDASDFAFTFVGNFDREVILGMAKKYLGNLPSTFREESYGDVGMRVIKGKHEDRIKRGEAPKSNVELYFHGDYEWSRENNYKLGSMIDYLRIKLREELREDKGGVYGVGVYGGGYNKPYERYGITISFNSDPDKTDELVEAAKEVIRRAVEEGPNELDMTKVIEIQRQGRIKNMKENRFWQNSIVNEHDNEKNFESITLESLEEAISKLTPGDIKAAAGKYFNYSNYLQFIMDPEPDAAN